MKKLLFTISMLLLLAFQAQSAGLVISNVKESRCLNNGSFTWSVSARVPANTYRLLVSQIPSGVNLNMLYPDTVAVNLFAASYAVDLLENGVSIKKDTVVIPGNFVNPTGFLDSTSKEVCPYTGKIYTSITGGRAPFTYVLKNSGGTTLATQTNNGVFTGITAGTYSVQITDSCGNIRNVTGINVTSLGGVSLRFGNSNMAIGGCEVGNCNGAASAIAEVFGQTCSGLGTIATAQVYNYAYGGTVNGLFRSNDYYYHTSRDMAINSTNFIDTGFAWTGDFTQPLTTSPNSDGSKTNRLIGMVGGIPPYKYYLRTPSGAILGPQSRPVWYNQPMGGIYMIIGEDACGSRDTLRTNTYTLPSLDSLYFTPNTASQNTCAPANQQTYSGKVSIYIRPDSLRVNTAVPANDFRRYMPRRPGVGPYTWEIESTTDPSFVLPPAVTSWARVSGGNFANPNATNTAGGRIDNLGQGNTMGWVFDQGNFPLYFKPTYSYMIKVTDQCGQVQKLNYAPPTTNISDTIEKLGAVRIRVSGCEDRFQFESILFPTSKPNREQLDMEIYDTSGVLLFRALNQTMPQSGIDFDNQSQYTFKTNYGGSTQSYMPYRSKLIFKMVGKCSGKVIYDTVSIARYAANFQVTPQQPCVPGGLGSVRLKRTFYIVSGTNDPRVLIRYGNDVSSPPLVFSGFWTPDSALNNVDAINAKKVTGWFTIAYFNYSYISDSCVLPNIPVGNYTVFMNPAMFGVINRDYWGPVCLCNYAQFKIIDYNSMLLEAQTRPVCAPDTASDITVLASAGRAPFRYQIKKASDPSYGALQSSNIFVNKVVGPYNVRVFDTCSNANTINVTVGGLQAFSIQGNSPLCAGSILRLKATSTQIGLRARWYKNGTLIAGAGKYSYDLYNAQAADAGTYKCVLEDTIGTCGKDSAQLAVTIVGGGSVTASALKNEICQGDTIKLSSTGSPGTWEWMSYPNFNPVTPYFTAATSNNTNVGNTFYTDGLQPYVALWSVNLGTCTANDTASVQIHKPINSFAGINAPLCSQATHTLAATSLAPDQLGMWSQSAGPATTIVSPALNNSQVTGMSAPNTYSYRWTVWNTADPNKVCAQSSVVTYRNVVNTIKQPNAGNDTVVCSSKTPVSLGLKANTIGSDTATMAWSIVSKPVGAVASISNTASPTTTFTANQGGDYLLEWSFTNICSVVRDTMKVTVVNGNAGPDRATCDTFGMSMQIAGSTIPSGMTARWTRLSNSAGSAVINDTTIYNPTVSTFTVRGKYYYEYRMIHPSCTVRDTMIITVNGIPTKPNAGTDSSMCANMIPLNGVLGSAADSIAKITWTKIGTTPNGGAIVKFDTLKTTATGVSVGTYTYLLTVQNAGCPARMDTVLRTITGLPPTLVVDSSKNITCSGYNDGKIYLTASPVGNYQYRLNNGSWQASPTFLNLSPGTYTAYVMDLNAPSCIGTAILPVTLTVTNTSPVANAGRDTVVCLGKLVQLGLAPVSGNTYLWGSALGMSSTSIANPIFSGGSSNVFTKTLEVTTTASGCKAYDTVIITVNALPTPAITSSNAAMCGGQTRTLTGTPAGGTFIGAQVSGATFTAPATAGSYTVRYAVTNAQGCSDTATQTIVVNAKIALMAITFSPSSVCVGSTTTATSTPTGGTWSVVSGPATINAASGLLSATGSTLVTVRYIHPGTAGASCPDTVTATITPTATPVAVLTSAVTPMCVNSTRALTGTPAGGTFTVLSGGGSITGTTLTATSAGTISLRYSVTSLGCSDDTVVSIVVNALPTVSITSSSASMCPAATRTLAGSPSGGTFSGTGVSGTTFTAPATPGSYTITYSFTDANGCVGSATQSITVNPKITLTAATASPSGTICAGTIVTFSSSPAGGTWSMIVGSGSVNPTTGVMNTTGLSSVQSVRYIHPGISGSSCPDTVTSGILVTTPPTANITSAVTPMCVNSTRILTGTPAGGTFTVLSGGGSITGTTLTAASAGTISLRYSVTSSGCSDDTVVSIVVNALPTVSISSSSAAMCPAETRTLVGSPTGGTFTGTGVTAGVFTAPATAGNNTITYTYTDANSCSNTATQTITVNPLVSLGAITFSPATVCSAGGTTTAAGTPAGGTWSVVSGPATINSSSGILTASGTGTITVRYSHPGVSSTSCPTTIDGTITPTANPVAVVTSAVTPMCVNATRALSGTPAGGTFTVVSGGGSLTGTTLTATAPGTISLKYSVTSSGCTDDTIVSIVVNALPTVSISSSSAAMCPAETRTLVGSPTGGTFTGTGVAAGVFTAPATAGNNTITYTYSDANSCSNTATQTIAVNPLITLSAVTFSKATACANAAANSTASATPAGGSWSIVSGPATINASSGAITATGTGAITVRYTHPGASGTSCPNTVDGTINGVANPTATPTAGTNPVCNGSSALISAGAGGTATPFTYAWAATGGGTAASHTASPNTTTIYQVTVTDANMCTASGSVTLTITGVTPLVANAGNDREICSGTSTSLGGAPSATGGSGGYTYNWSSAAGAIANPSVSPTATTSYYLTVQSAGCSAFDTVVVTVNAKPLIAPSATSSAICIGNSTTLNGGGSGGTGALSYTWSNNATGTPITVSPTTSITYTVTVKDTKLCEAVGSVAITVNPLPVVSITSSSGNICQGSTRTLVGSPAGGTFSGTGVSGTTFTAITPGSYSITYSFTNGNGCTNTAMQTIVVDPSPIVSAGSNDTICLGASKVLTGSQVTSLTGVLYEWYIQGSTTPIPPLGTSVTVSPLTTTIYEFVGTKGNCSHKATMNLGVVGKPNLIDDMTACQAATEDVATTWPLTNITANDINTAVIKGGVTYTILSAKHGTASISGANINYQASLNYNGLDTIRVVGTSDSCSGLKDTAIFCVNVASVNDAPVAVNDTATTSMGVPVSKNLLTNDSDVDHTLTGGNITIVNGPNNGNLSAISPTGELTYTPRPFFVGIDTVEYQVCDGGMPIICRNAFAYFNVSPKILDTVTTTNRNTTIPITVGPALEGTLANASVTPSKPSGTAVINPMTGAVTITPSSIPFIGKDTFVRIVEVMTTNGLVRDTSFIVIDNPNSGDTLRGTTNRNMPVAFPMLMDVNLKGTPLAPVVDPTLKVNTDGTVTYTPKSGFVGIDTARIVRCDNLGNCHTMVYIVTVKPDVADSAALTTTGSPVSVGLPITRYPGQSINTSVLNPTDNGTVVVNPDGFVTYTPNPNFVGRDTLLREVCVYDTASMTNICDTIRTIFTVLPKPLDDRTIAAAGTSVTAGKPITTLSGTKTEITPVGPKNGTAVVNPDGTVNYTPNPGFVGSDTVKLTVCVYDSVSMKTVCNTSTVVFHVLSVNPDVSTGTNVNTPVTAGKPVSKIPGTSTDITNTGSSNGTATINPDGTVTYTPRTGFVGKDTVTRIVCVYDSTSKKTICDTVKMYFSVYPANLDTSVTTVSGKPVTAGTPVPSLPGVRTDITSSSPANGSAIVNPDGTVTYTPRLGFSGVDTIRRIICRYDSVAKTTYCDTSLIIVTVEPELAQIPNYFSPNGDGVNDVWNLDGLLARYPKARAMVYNRWGNIVWRSTGSYGRSTSGNNLWYGQLEGSQELVPDGVYYYLLELDDEFKTTKTGFIEIMRQ